MKTNQLTRLAALAILSALSACTTDRQAASYNNPSVPPAGTPPATVTQRGTLLPPGSPYDSRNQSGLGQ